MLSSSETSLASTLIMHCPQSQHILHTNLQEPKYSKHLFDPDHFCVPRKDPFYFVDLDVYTACINDLLHFFQLPPGDMSLVDGHSDYDACTDCEIDSIDNDQTLANTDNLATTLRDAIADTETFFDDLYEMEEEFLCSCTKSNP
jgi:hypothetical protein